ncbi:hypothetical protein V8G54_006048, partial [Vigna mungo]
PPSSSHSFNSNTHNRCVLLFHIFFSHSSLSFTSFYLLLSPLPVLFRYNKSTFPIFSAIIPLPFYYLTLSDSSFIAIFSTNCLPYSNYSTFFLLHLTCTRLMEYRI